MGSSIPFCKFLHKPCRAFSRLTSLKNLEILLVFLRLFASSYEKTPSNICAVIYKMKYWVLSAERLMRGPTFEKRYKMDILDVLVIGGGGREHAICRSLKKSKRVGRLYCAPGNAGIGLIAERVSISATDVDAVVRFAKDNHVDFVVVAPDDPLALGMVDALDDAGIRAFGPRKGAAMLESSKIYAKSIMEKYSIPTAEHKFFSDAGEAKAYIIEHGAPIVVKADGLALGKGVVVATSIDEALNAVDMMMLDKKFGQSGSRIVVEEFMTGTEVTVLVFTDGETIAPMLSSQDYKRAHDGDQGPNTGGMGAFCPSPAYTDDIAEVCMETIIHPTVAAMKTEGRPFKGVLYFGLMLTQEGPRVVEYNARFGDPEAQPILSLLETDLLDIFEAIVDERLHEIDIRWREGYACCVVIASGGYPGAYAKGAVIRGLDNVPDDITVFHAGTELAEHDMEKAYITSGGRVLGVTATGDTLESAASRAYEGVGCISIDGAFYRSDIGRRE